MLLDTIAWDLCADASGNMAMASNPYSLAQDAASAVRLFKGEYIYDTTQGLPYFQDIFGPIANLNLLKSLTIAQAMTVPEVASAQCFISSFKNRAVTGQIQVTSTSGQTSTAGFFQ